MKFLSIPITLSRPKKVTVFWTIFEVNGISLAKCGILWPNSPTNMGNKCCLKMTYLANIFVYVCLYNKCLFLWQDLSWMQVWVWFVYVHSWGCYTYIDADSLSGPQYFITSLHIWLLSPFDHCPPASCVDNWLYSTTLRRKIVRDY